LKIGVFTCIIPYDYVSLQSPIYIDKNVDYWVISDAVQDVYPWRDYVVVPERESSLREIQEYRVLLHKWFPDYDYYIWVDGEVRLKVSPTILVKLLQDSDHGIMFIGHPWRDCIYDEANVYIGFGAVDPFIIKKQLHRYRESGYPEHEGLITVNFFVRDNTSNTIRLMERWHRETENGCCRTQMSFNYASWVEKVPYYSIPWDILGPSMSDRKVCLWQDNVFYRRKGYVCV
jgi:hypothetical protein